MEIAECIDGANLLLSSLGSEQYIIYHLLCVLLLSSEAGTVNSLM